MNRATIVLALCATACTTTYTKQGATDADFRIDNGQCNAQAMSAAPPTGLTAIGQKEAIRAACLEGKGWVRAK
jgi:hypothetical protein